MFGVEVYVCLHQPMYNLRVREAREDTDVLKLLGADVLGRKRGVPLLPYRLTCVLGRICQAAGLWYLDNVPPVSTYDHTGYVRTVTCMHVGCFCAGSASSCAMCRPLGKREQHARYVHCAGYESESPKIRYLLHPPCAIRPPHCDCDWVYTSLVSQASLHDACNRHDNRLLSAWRVSQAHGPTLGNAGPRARCSHTVLLLPLLL